MKDLPKLKGYFINNRFIEKKMEKKMHFIYLFILIVLSGQRWYHV